MSVEMVFNYNLETKRCFECGTFWAVESGKDIASNVCPRCAGDKIRQANDRADAAERSMRSLRGNVTKMKKRR